MSSHPASATGDGRGGGASMWKFVDFANFIASENRGGVGWGGGLL